MRKNVTERQKAKKQKKTSKLFESYKEGQMTKTYKSKDRRINRKKE